MGCRYRTFRIERKSGASSIVNFVRLQAQIAWGGGGERWRGDPFTSSSARARLSSRKCSFTKINVRDAVRASVRVRNRARVRDRIGFHFQFWFRVGLRVSKALLEFRYGQ